MSGSVKRKVYLSKSKRANMDDLIRVRTDLIKNGYIIKEFTGGVYSDKELKDSDFVILFPPYPFEYNEDSEDILVGKGLGSELKTAAWNNIPTYLYKNSILHEVHLIDMEVYDVNDWAAKYYYIELPEGNIANFNEVFPVLPETDTKIDDAENIDEFYSI